MMIWTKSFKFGFSTFLLIIFISHFCVRSLLDFSFTRHKNALFKYSWSSIQEHFSSGAIMFGSMYENINNILKIQMKIAVYFGLQWPRLKHQFKVKISLLTAADKYFNKGSVNSPWEMLSANQTHTVLQYFFWKLTLKLIKKHCLCSNNNS